MTMTPTDDPGATPGAESDSSPTDDFVHALEALLFESFAKGATVQGVREIVSPSAAVPTWRVTVEKIADGETPDDGAVFLDD